MSGDSCVESCDVVTIIFSVIHHQSPASTNHSPPLYQTDQSELRSMSHVKCNDNCQLSNETRLWNILKESVVVVVFSWVKIEADAKTCV